MHLPAAPADLRVRLYGDPAVVLPDGRVVALEPRAAAVLALAALEPGISRLRVATLLWPDSSDARRNLRQQLLRFRRLFAHPLVQGDRALSLTAEVLEAPADDSAALLLAGNDYQDCEEFAAWVSRQREARQSRRLDATRQRLVDCEAAGDLDAALATASDLLALEYRNESNHRELMRLNYLRGDSAAGLNAYQRMKEMLDAEYNVRPSAASETLAAVLRANLEQNKGSAASPSSVALRLTRPVVLKRPPLLAGRQNELAAVRLHWAEGRAVLLEGEAGLGKSRLMDELMANTETALISAGRPGDSGAPYSTLARLLRPLTADSPTDLSAPTREALAHIAASVVPARPALAISAERAAAAPFAGPALTPLRPGAMACAVSELLRRRSVQAIALDDLHFVDDATLDLIAGLVAQGDPPLRWLFAGRPVELPAAAVTLRSSLTEQQQLGVVTLTALDEGAIATIVDALAIEGLDSAVLASALLRHTGGNPLFVLETLKHGVSDGTLARGQLPRPSSVGSLIERRLQSLSEPALTLARVAAIAGVDFSVELAESAIGVRAVQLATAWSELQVAQVLRDEDFAHDLVRDAVLRSVPPVVARRVHGQCAQWLAAHSVEPARVAWHWRLGGAPAEAGRAFVAAAVRAEAAARLREEASLYLHAAQAFADADLNDERFAALLGRVRSLSAATFDDQAMEECRALAATAATDAQRLRAQSELCGLLTERGEPLAAIEAGQAAMEVARRLVDFEWQVRTACHMATALCRLGRAQEAVALLAPLRSWVESQTDDALRVLWHGDWGAALGHAGRLSEAVAAYDAALDAARRIGLRDAEGRLLLNCSVTLRQSGQFDRALLLSRQGRALSAAENQGAGELPIDALILARDEAEGGHYTSAITALETVLTAFEQRGTAFWLQACRMVLLRLWLDLGQHARAAQMLRDEPADLPAWLRADRRLLQLELARALQQPTPAGLLDEVLKLSVSDPQRGPGLQVRALRALPPAQVLDQAPALARTLAAHERFGTMLALHVHVVRAAMAEGQADVAAGSARAALVLVGKGYSPESMYRPEAHLVAWRALVQVGAGAEAAAALQSGTDWVRSHALPHVPIPFLDSFLNRNPCNRELLAAASRA